jgi:hypothetical protein
MLDQFPLVVCAEVHGDSQNLRQVCSFLGLFAPVHAQDAQIKSTAHSVLPAALLLLEQYYNIILMLQKESQPSDSLNEGILPSKNFLGAADHLDYLDPLTATQEI